jgi:hypothetical protein
LIPVVPLSDFRQTKYDLAKNIFNAERIFGDYCLRCKSIKYFSFRQGTRYLTAQATNLNFITGTNPTADQLFEGIQNSDKTWSFKASNGRYIRANADLITINYNNAIGLNERFYIERHGNHVHIQSANFYHVYWATFGSLLRLLNGGASPYVIEYYPNINWLWN